MRFLTKTDDRMDKSSRRIVAEEKAVMEQKFQGRMPFQPSTPIYLAWYQYFNFQFHGWDIFRNCKQSNKNNCQNNNNITHKVLFRSVIAKCGKNYMTKRKLKYNSQHVAMVITTI